MTRIKLIRYVTRVILDMSSWFADLRSAPDETSVLPSRQFGMQS